MVNSRAIPQGWKNVFHIKTLNPASFHPTNLQRLYEEILKPLFLTPTIERYFSRQLINIIQSKNSMWKL